MRALTWQGNLDVQVTDVPDPRIQEPNDAIIKVTSTAICGSDLHLYGVLGPYLSPGDVLGHEAMGVPEHRTAAARFGNETLDLEETADTAQTRILALLGAPRRR